MKDPLPAPSSGPIIPDQRREQILRQLRRHQVLSVHQLMDMFDCSHMTIRRDIAVLEKDGQAYSVPGGVRIASAVATEPSHQSKAVAELPHKQAMAAQAAQALRSNMTLYLDAGTTTLALVPHICALAGMTVVTNDFSIVMALAEAQHVTVIHTGGVLDHPNLSGVGDLAAETLSRIATDVAFMSTASWDLKRGITTPSPAKVAVKRAAMVGASKRILIATSSKYGTFGMYKIAPLQDFDLIITDVGLAEAAAGGVTQEGVELALVDVPELD